MNSKTLPNVFLERLLKIVPASQWSLVEKSFSCQRNVTIRVNTFKTTREQLAESLSKNSIETQRVGWYENALTVLNQGTRTLQNTEAYQRGEFYIQNLSSMIPVIVLSPQPGEAVLDMTAAPGSKASQIAIHMNGRGIFVANDNHRQRFFKMKSILEQQGVSNVQLSCQYGENFGKTHPEFFDKILLDAPCSTEGRFNLSDPDTFQYWKISKCKEMSKKQKRLILSAVQALKPGGVLVYSTCTFAPEENEEVLNWMLRKVEGQVRFEKIELPLANVQVPLQEWGGKFFSPDIKNAIRILPDESMEGFFVAKMIKKA